MNCERTSKLSSKDWDGELSAAEHDILERHLQECTDCHAQDQVWEKYEHKISHYYQSHRLGEDFVQKMHQRVAFLNMESVEPKHPGIAGRIQVPAIRWLQPVGLAAGLLLAVMLFALRGDPSLGRWMAGQGFLMTGPANTAVELGRNSHRIVLPGDFVWTNVSQQLKIQLPGDVPVSLSKRGLLSLSATGSSQEGSARLHSGKVELNAPGSHRSFTLNTAAGRIRGEAGRIDVTADWVSLTQKKWKSAGSNDSWTEGWQAFQMARVDVSEGSAEVVSAAGSETDLNPGQSAIMSAAFSAPVVSDISESPNKITVSTIEEADSTPRITSELLSGESQFRIATTFINIPLQTILSSVAEVQPSQIEIDPAVKASSRSLRVVRPVTATAESVLSAVAGFSGLGYEKADRSITTDIVDVPPSLSLENQHGSAKPQLTLEMEGSDVKLLRGSGVRMSVLARAIESAVDSPVETASADWALNEFELRDVPRAKIREALTRKLGLQFQQETRTVPYYRIRTGNGDRRQSQGLKDILGNQIRDRQFSSSGDYRVSDGSMDFGAAGRDNPQAGPRDGSQQGNRSHWGRKRGLASRDWAASGNPINSISGEIGNAGNASIICNALSEWLGNFPASLLSYARLSPAIGPSGVSNPGTGVLVAGQSTSGSSGAAGSSSLGLQIIREQAQHAMSLLERRVQELEAGKRILFPPFDIESLNQDPEIQPLGLLFFSLFNETHSAAEVRIQCRAASGIILIAWISIFHSAAS